MMKAKRCTACADPADVPRGHTGNDSVVGNIGFHDGTRPDQGIPADGDTADDSRVGPYGGAALHKGWAEFRFAFNEGAGIIDIRKHAGWAAKDLILKGNTSIDRYIVLDFAPVSDNDIPLYADILADNTGFADPGIGEDMTEMPDFRAGPDLDIVIDKTAGMDKITLTVHHSPPGRQGLQKGVVVALKTDRFGISDSIGNLD